MNSVIKFIDENLVRTIHNNTKDIDTLLGLPYPYTVPCADDTFLEMYYWDTYFTNVGLLKIGMEEQAKNNVDDMLYLVEKYGFMPNGNRTYYLNRSQPPFLYQMVSDIFDKYGDRQWLEKAYTTLKKEYEFWQTKRLAPNGLNFYGNYEGFTPDRIDKLNIDFQKRSGGFATSDSQLRKSVAKTVMTFVESGWDCNSRFELDGEHYNPVDLNSLMYGFEKKMSKLSRILSLNEFELWEDRANTRKEKMQKYMWNNQEKIYMDWNFKKECFSPIRSAASLYPMFVKLADDISGCEILLNELLLKYGVSSSTPDNCKFSLQWDYPNIWPPVQFLSFVGCKNYGLDEMANTIAKKYVKLINENYAVTGNLWEKYDGNDGSVANQDYNAPAMLGWTAGVYIYFKEKLKG